jgi:hypothetical protein
MDAAMQHQADKGHEMQAGNDGGHTFVVVAQAADAARPREGARDDPAPGQQHEPLLGLRQRVDVQLDAARRRVLLDWLPRVALIDEAHRHGVPGRFLHRLDQHRHLRPILLIGRRHHQGQQVAQRIDRHVDLRSLLALGAIVAIVPSALPALRGRLPGRTVEPDRARLEGAARRPAQ